MSATLEFNVRRIAEAMGVRYDDMTEDKRMALVSAIRDQLPMLDGAPEARKPRAPRGTRFKVPAGPRATLSRVATLMARSVSVFAKRNEKGDALDYFADLFAYVDASDTPATFTGKGASWRNAKADAHRFATWLRDGSNTSDGKPKPMAAAAVEKEADALAALAEANERRNAAKPPAGPAQGAQPGNGTAPANDGEGW